MPNILTMLNKLSIIYVRPFKPKMSIRKGAKDHEKDIQNLDGNLINRNDFDRYVPAHQRIR